jgi:hypothetical protein
MKGFRRIRQAQLHFEQTQAPLPAGPGAPREDPDQAYEHARQDAL